MQTFRRRLTSLNHTSTNPAAGWLALIGGETGAAGHYSPCPLGNILNKK